MPRKTADPLAAFNLSDKEREDMERISDLFVQFGRAIGLSMLTATAKTMRQEAGAHEAADKAWKNLATDIMVYAMESGQ